MFLDRDGTLMRECNYTSRPEQVRLIAGSAEAVRSLRAAGFKVVLITNQAGIGRGYFTLAHLKRVNAKLQADLKKGGTRLDGVYFCPHAPDAGCECRKPGTKMVRDAAKDLKLDLSRSWFVGDNTADVACGQAAGCVSILVLTGKAGRDGKVKVKPDHVSRNLAAAARLILRLSQG